MNALYYLLYFFVWIISAFGYAFDAWPTRPDPINQLVDRFVEAMRDGETEAAAQYFLATHVPRKKNEGMVLGVRMGVALQIMKKNGWILRAQDALNLSEQIAPKVSKFDCQQPMFSEVAMHLLRNQNQEAAVQIIKKYRLLRNVPGSPCGAIDLRTLSIALELDGPELTIEDKMDFWIQANVVVNLRPQILTDEQRKKFTEVIVDHRLPHLNRASAYKFMAAEAAHYKMYDYAAYLQAKAIAER